METLGETLGRVLTENARFSEVEAPEPVLTPDPLMHTAAQFARAMAFAGSLSFDEIWDVLITVPDNMLSGLNSPEGWAALSAYVGQSCGIIEPVYIPSVH